MLLIIEKWQILSLFPIRFIFSVHMKAVSLGPYKLLGLNGSKFYRINTKICQFYRAATRNTFKPFESVISKMRIER
jgi:hypothetical protein